MIPHFLTVPTNGIQDPCFYVAQVAHLYMHDAHGCTVCIMCFQSGGLRAFLLHLKMWLMRDLMGWKTNDVMTNKFVLHWSDFN